jgi:hypothetical protein
MAVTPGENQQNRSAEDPEHTLSLGNSMQKWPVIESALGSWSKTARLCLILIALGISTAVSYGLGFLLWLIVR